MSQFLEKKLIIIPYDLPKNWSADFIYQTQNILFKKNLVIAFLWEEALSIKEIFLKKFNFGESFHYWQKGAGVIYIRPIHLLPFRRFHSIKNFNLFLNIIWLKILIALKKINKKGKILWLFHPDFWFLPKIFGKSYLTIYDCVDFFTSKDKEECLKRKEVKLLKNADEVFVNSNVLYNDKKKYRQNIHIVPQGFSFDIFNSSQKLSQDNFIFNLKKPIIGYVGGINHRLDYSLLNKLIKNNPKLTFLFIGPFQKDPSFDLEKELDKLKKMKNVYFQEFKDKKLIPAAIKQFDIGLIPYDISQNFNKYCYPMKIFEYFYLGKPVVSTAIEELKQFPNLVKIASNAEDFSQAIKEILKNGWPLNYSQKQKILALNNTWQKKIDKIDKILSQNDF